MVKQVTKKKSKAEKEIWGERVNKSCKWITEDLQHIVHELGMVYDGMSLKVNVDERKCWWSVRKRERI